ncbi:hypothetical protein OAK75_10510 [Bacteriovoracales bacterium]|nr:hypothetical protein [Bacteriovoracales bacterium]
MKEKKVPKRDRFDWEGFRPSRALWKRMFELYSPPIRNGGKLKIFTFEDILSYQQVLEEKNLFFRREGHFFYLREVFQKVHLHSSWDKELLKSSRGWFVREAYQIKGKTLMGETLSGPLVKGSTNKVGNILESLKTIKKLSAVAKKSGDSLKLLEISHNHPSLEIIQRHEGSTKFFLNGLSSSDLRFHKELFRELGKKIPIRMSAITPYGHSYSYSLPDKNCMP